MRSPGPDTNGWSSARTATCRPTPRRYEAVDSLWLYRTNGNILGGGQVVLTGPSFVDASNVNAVAKYAARGTR